MCCEKKNNKKTKKQQPKTKHKITEKNVPLWKAKTTKLQMLQARFD